MVQNHNQEPSGVVPRVCPRCGGRMFKPAGATLYWHLDYNHPRCDITNLADPPLMLQESKDELPAAPAPKKGRTKK